MSRPAIGSYAERVYALLEPVAKQDEALGWPLLLYIDALCVNSQVVEDIVRDTDDGPGWARLFDPALAPEWALPWLAQLAGVVLPSAPALSVADQRLRIAEQPALRRGTRAAIVSTAQAYLTGTRQVFIVERTGGAYGLTIRTFLSETPDPDALLAALLRTQKPAGIVLDYAAVIGQDWATVVANYATWADVSPTWLDVVEA